MTTHISWDDDALLLLDQRLLPREQWVECRDWREVARAIKTMIVRGAPLIGVTAAYGCALAALNYANSPNWRQDIARALDELARARPTAVNLTWAIEKARPALETATSAAELAERWLADARALRDADEGICRQIGRNGAPLVPDKASILTHCNAGALATAGYGTALGVVRAAAEAGKEVSVIADETRPFLQGARLTAWELARDRIPVKIACDNACAWLMANGKVDLVVVGADRIAANGDAANKIGTLGVAILAKHYDIPFYVAAPLSTFDLSSPTGASIPIEERPADEVLVVGGQKMAEVDAFNYAFDVTPASLITAIITEKGVVQKPDAQSVKRLFDDAPANPAS